MIKQDTPILFPYAPDELWDKFRELIREELQKANALKKQEVSYEVSGFKQKPLFKAGEVCQMLQISRQTLHAWNKEGILKPYKIKSRVFYLYSDLEKLIASKEVGK